MNNRFTLAQLKALMPAFDWDSYLHAIGAPSVPLYEVSAPDFFRAENKLLEDEDLANLKLYLRAHLLLAAPRCLEMRGVTQHSSLPGSYGAGQAITRLAAVYDCR